MLREERSYERITMEDLRKLRDLSLKEKENFFERNPHLKKTYWNSLIAIALCQGAALHFIDHKTGIRDFDIYFLFDQYNKRLINRMPKTKDSELAKFGKHPDDDKKGCKGRRVDFLRKAIDNDIARRNKREPKNCIIGIPRKRKD